MISVRGFHFKIIHNTMPEPICSICKTPMVDQTKHRECLLKGLESGEVQSRRDWLAKSKPKAIKVIRKVLIDQSLI